MSEVLGWEQVSLAGVQERNILALDWERVFLALALGLELARQVLERVSLASG